MEQFKEDLKQGKRPTYDQLRKLNTQRKKEYIKVVKKDDDEANEYIAYITEKIHESQDEIHEMIMAITDTTDIWEKTQDEIKDLIQVRLEEVTKKKNFNF